jgi:uncharacterized protein YndB with AHSA1/START domain
MERKIEATRIVRRRSREEVFRELKKVESFPEWAFGLPRVEVLSGGGEPGTEIEFNLSAAGMTHRVTSVVRLIEEPHRIEWRYTQGAEGYGGWRLREVRPGVLEVTLYTDYHIRPRWLDRLAHRKFFVGVTNELLGRSLDRLVRRLEDGV